MIFFYIGFLFLMFQQPLCSINIKLLKNTHTILDNSDYAPFRGLAFLEANIAEQFYRLNPSFQIKEIQTEVAKVRKEISDQEEKNIDDQEYIEKINKYEPLVIEALSKIKQNATADLVMNMFHIAGNVFNVTSAQNNPVRLLAPKHIGAICRIIAGNNLDRLLLEGDELFKAELLTHIATRKKLTPEDQVLPIKSLFEQYKKFILIDESEVLLPIIMQKYLKAKLVDYLYNLKLVKKIGSDGIFQKKDFYPFVNAIIGSLEECNPLNVNQQYPKNTTQGILLGYMLAKVHDILDLQDYFRGFLNDESFILSHDEYTNSELLEISETEIDITNISSVADYLCAALYVKNYMAGLPKMSSALEVAYQGNNFPDCVETMMRNLANIITYDSANQTLGNIPLGLTANEQLKVFYANKYNANPAMISSENVHRAWLKLVENQEGCSYNRLVIRGTLKHITSSGKCDGFIPMEKVDSQLPQKEIDIADKKFIIFEKQVDQKTYWLIPASAGLDCFELMPTVTNIILLLNRLFNLNLQSLPRMVFNKIQGSSLADESLRSDFVKTYFERMCNKLKWVVSQETLEQIKLLSNSSNQSIDILIELATGYVFHINIFDGMHGNINVPKEVFSRFLSAIDFFKLSESLQAIFLAADITPLSELLEPEFKELRSKLPPIDKFIPAINKEEKISLLQYLLKENKDEDYTKLLLLSFSLEVDLHFQQKLFTAIAEVSDSVNVGQLLIIKLLADAYYDFYNFFVMGKVVCSLIEKNYEQMWYWIDKGLQSDIEITRQGIISLLEQLFDSGKLQNELLKLERINLILSLIDQNLITSQEQGQQVFNLLQKIHDIQSDNGIKAKILTAQKALKAKNLV